MTEFGRRISLLTRGVIGPRKILPEATSGPGEGDQVEKEGFRDRTPYYAIRFLFSRTSLFLFLANSFLRSFIHETRTRLRGPATWDANAS